MILFGWDIPGWVVYLTVIVVVGAIILALDYWWAPRGEDDYPMD